MGLVDMTGLGTYNIYFGLGMDKRLFLVRGAMDDVRGCSVVDVGSGWRS